MHYVLFRWGFIGSLRVDNGHPFGTPTRQAYSPLFLHLLALGIQVHINPVRSPKHNAKVERTQGTTCRWADPPTCTDYLELQQRLNEAVIIQRQYYPSRACQGKTRTQYYPKLLSNPKRFHPSDFDMNRVYQFLAKSRWKRKVSSHGAVSVFNKAYQVGYKHRGKSIIVHFDAFNLCWSFKDQNNQLLTSHKAVNITEQHLKNLSYFQ